MVLNVIVSSTISARKANPSGTRRDEIHVDMNHKQLDSNTTKRISHSSFLGVRFTLSNQNWNYTGFEVK